MKYSNKLSVKITALLLSAAILTALCGCGTEKTPGGSTTVKLSQTVPQTDTQPEATPTKNGDASPSQTGDASESQTQKAPPAQPLTQSVPQDTSASPLPVTALPVERSKRSVYGEQTGNTETYTGLEPLPLADFTVTDPDNTRGLSEETHNHSYGVSSAGQPHEISVNNARYYEPFGAFTLDTSGEKLIYLTFDCGYENGYTAPILNTLSEKGVPAAFFVTLPYLKSAPELAARMINDGHVVGNHSDNHPDFSAISRTRMAAEIKTVDDCLRTQFGYSSPFFRFPGGACNESALKLVQELGYTSVFWSSAYSDWDVQAQKGADYAFETVTARLHPGCVLLLHAVSSDNAAALGRIIDYAKAEGYTFAALS